LNEESVHLQTKFPGSAGLLPTVLTPEWLEEVLMLINFPGVRSVNLDLFQDLPLYVLRSLGIGNTMYGCSFS